MEPTLEQEMLEQSAGGQLTCARAMAIASRLVIDPAAVGRAANQAGVRISHCQLGLFGYGPKVEGKHKIVRPLPHIPADMEAALRAAASDDGIPCADLWQVADRLALSRMEASGAAESLGVHVSDCQLGCFPRRREGS